MAKQLIVIDGQIDFDTGALPLQKLFYSVWLG